MTTVGREGFLSMLPVYIDHVLYPTLVSKAKCKNHMQHLENGSMPLFIFVRRTVAT